ncbi:MAG: LysE family translocator [Verrucomicrobia bacterium]|nr:LysE family translocator [Verrucomicrobiota bacterium]
MTVTSELWMFAGLIVLGQFSPGPDMVLLTRTALREGSKAGVEMASGITCGLAVHSTIAVGGVAVAFLKFPMLRWVLQWVAAFYLLWLAYGLLMSAYVAWRTGLPHEPAAKASTHPPFVRGLLCNLFNPKVPLFLAAVCAPFLAGNHPHPAWWPMAIWGVVVGLGIGLWSLWVVLLQWRPLRARYECAAGWIDGVFGAALAALALRLMIG